MTGYGLGHSFLKAILAYVKSNFSFLRITLAVAEFNTRAIQLYEKIGFKKTEMFNQKTNDGEYEFIRMEHRLVPPSVEEIIRGLTSEVRAMLNGNYIGFYIHGSLAMGGFNPTRSDVDILIVTKQPLSEHAEQHLRKILLIQSRDPFPVEA